MEKLTKEKVSDIVGKNGGHLIHSSGCQNHYLVKTLGWVVANQGCGVFNNYDRLRFHFFYNGLQKIRICIL